MTIRVSPARSSAADVLFRSAASSAALYRTHASLSLHTSIALNRFGRTWSTKCFATSSATCATRRGCLRIASSFASPISRRRSSSLRSANSASNFTSSSAFATVQSVRRTS